MYVLAFEARVDCHPGLLTEHTSYYSRGSALAPSRRIRKLLAAFRLPLVHFHSDLFFSQTLILPVLIVCSPWPRSHWPFFQLHDRASPCLGRCAHSYATDIPPLTELFRAEGAAARDRPPTSGVNKTEGRKLDVGLGGMGMDCIVMASRFDS